MRSGRVYIAVRPSADVAERLAVLAHELRLDRALAPDQLHCTLAVVDAATLSMGLDVPLGVLEPAWVAETVAPRLRVSRLAHDDIAVTVAVQFECAALRARWRNLLNATTPDSPQLRKDAFVAHMTLTYHADMGDITRLSCVDVHKALPGLLLEFVEEYAEAYVDTWA